MSTELALVVPEVARASPPARLSRLLQLVSPSLPIGTFAYSRGLEAAVELGWVKDLAGARRWILGRLEESAAKVDAPLLARLHAAIRAGDWERARRWAHHADATRETRELELESRRTGASLARLLVDLDLATTEEREALEVSHLAVFALAAHRFELDAALTLHGYLFAWLEAEVTAAIKLVPLGQTDGQRLLLEGGAVIASLVERALRMEDAEIGAFSLGVAIASSLHESQHTRLFRS